MENNVYIRNVSGIAFTIGDITLSVEDNIQIWSSSKVTGYMMACLDEIAANMASFNQGIGIGSLIMINGTAILSQQEAFNLYDFLKTEYARFQNVKDDIRLQSLFW
jgi:hypothetical protein